MSDDRKSLSEPSFTAHFCPDGTQNHGMVGASSPMQALFAALPRIAATNSPLLVTGERGTGKDLIAKAVHALSGRAGRPFLTVDCSEAPDDQLDALLAGAFAPAEGGTVVLNGVGGLSVGLQARLLRALRSVEDGAPRAARGRHGVRIISTTDIDLASAVEENRFREALYYRLNVVGIVAPPLRERGTDVQLLADHFLDVFTTPASRRRVVGFSAEARLAMQQWNWPGNVRELVNRVKQAIVMCEKGPLSSGDLDLGNRTRGSAAMTLDEAREAAELSALLAALAAANGDLGKAAARLGTSRVALCKLMHKHRIDVASPQLVVDSVR